MTELRAYVIGLGANLGDRLGTLRSALASLRALGTIRGVSHLYETAAVGPPQPDFLNAAVLLESNLTPVALLRELLEIERRHGRQRRERWGPRTLDLDLLFSPDLQLSEPELILPHAELSRRAFALAPLLDVAPSAREPHSDRSYADVFRALEASDIRRAETNDGWCPSTAE